MELNSLDNKIVQAMLNIFGLCTLKVKPTRGWRSGYVEVSNTFVKISYVPMHSRFYVENKKTFYTWSSDGTLDDMDYVNGFLQEVKKEVYGE